MTHQVVMLSVSDCFKFMCSILIFRTSDPWLEPRYTKRATHCLSSRCALVLAHLTADKPLIAGDKELHS